MSQLARNGRVQVIKKKTGPLLYTADFLHHRYAKKCRFAHGPEELRCVQRHMKYKTEICKTFHLTGTCLYGVRCTFIHDEPATTAVVSSPTISIASVFSSNSSSASESIESSPTFFATKGFNYTSTFSLDDDLLQSWGAMTLAAPPSSPMPTKKDYSSIWSLDRRYSSSSTASSLSLLSVPFAI